MKLTAVGVCVVVVNVVVTIASRVKRAPFYALYVHMCSVLKYVINIAATYSHNYMFIIM